MSNSQYFPPYLTSSNISSEISVNLDLTSYATKTDLDNITHVDTSAFALKINLASLKTEVDKLTTVPSDLDKLTKEVQADFTKKTNFSALEKKVTGNKTEEDSLETKVPNSHLTTKYSINSLKTKVDGIDLTKYIKKSDYDTKTNTFNSKVNELEIKIKTAETKADTSNLANKAELKNVENKIPDINVFVKKTDYATDISGIKNDYVANAALTSQLNDVKSHHVADEVKKVDDKVTKSSSDILGFESRLRQKEDLTTELEKEVSFSKGNYYYNQQSYLHFEPKTSSFNKTGNDINNWLSTGIHNESNIDLDAASNSSSTLPRLFNHNNRLNVGFAGNLLKQDKITYFHGAVVNIYIVYKLQKRTVNSPDFTVQNALFGAVQITKDVNTSDYKYSGYGICFGSGSSFSFDNSLTAKNVSILGCDMPFSSHANNRANNIYILGKDFMIVIYLLMVFNN